LKEKSGLPIRLPTEAEWEKAARGTEGKIYPWGDEDPKSYFWDHQRLHTVGRYPYAASPYGVQDICENIGEFVADFYDENYYQVSPHRNPKGPSEGFWHVIRGKEMRAYARESEEKPINPRFGFRCAFSDAPSIPSVVQIKQEVSSFQSGFTVIKENNYQEVLVSIAEGVDISFMHVPAGEFLMGSPVDDKEAKDDQKPQHLVYLNDYWIGKFPVTLEQYTAIRPGHAEIIDENRKNPVYNVIWTLAEEYCKTLENLAKLPIRLPTEAEWEKAARGTDARLYPWGNQIPTSELAHYQEYNKYFAPSPVDEYPLGASPYGVMDMGGNLMEWTADWFDENYYSVSPFDNPTGPEDGDYKIIRGGISEKVCVWRHFGLSSFFLSEWLQFIGFRCVLEKLP
jgi:formylglycine-generating enzyme required for sulfatase activity